MDSVEHIRLYPATVLLARTAGDFDIKLDLGFGITMNTRLVLACDVEPLSSDDPEARDLGRKAHQFATDWLADQPEKLIGEVITEVGGWIVGDLFNHAGDSLTFDLLNVGLAEAPIRVS